MKSGKNTRFFSENMSVIKNSVRDMGNMDK